MLESRYLIISLARSFVSTIAKLQNSLPVQETVYPVKMLGFGDNCLKISFSNNEGIS